MRVVVGVQWTGRVRLGLGGDVMVHVLHDCEESGGLLFQICSEGSVVKAEAAERCSAWEAS